MALGQYIKGEMLKVFEDKINRSRTIILCMAQGLKAGEMDELRRKMGAERVEFFLMKKTLASRAFKKADIDISAFLNGDTFYAFGENDPIAVSRALVNFAKTHEALKIKGGVIDKKVVDVGEVKRFANIPCREILLQQLISRITAPMTNLALVLQGSLHKLVLTVEAIKEAKKT